MNQLLVLTSLFLCFLVGLTQPAAVKITDLNDDGVIKWTVSGPTETEFPGPQLTMNWLVVSQTTDPDGILTGTPFRQANDTRVIFIIPTITEAPGMWSYKFGFQFIPNGFKRDRRMKVGCNFRVGTVANRFDMDDILLSTNRNIKFNTNMQLCSSCDKSLTCYFDFYMVSSK